MNTSLIIICIIIIILLIIISIFTTILKSNEKSKQTTLLGGSYRIGFDINNLATSENFYDDTFTTSELNLIMNSMDKKHDSFLNYLCEYINTTDITLSTTDKSLIVGDVHGSVLQLFMPLKQANILKHITIINNKFVCTISEDYENYKQIIYCGDFVGRARHTLTISMLYEFINIYNKVNKLKPDTIVWVFGNHDVGFIRKFIFNFVSSNVHVYKSELNSITNDLTELNILKNNMIELIKNNKWVCVYKNKNIMVSHTLISKYKNNYCCGLNCLYNLFNNLMPQFKNIIDNNFDNIKSISRELYKIFKVVDKLKWHNMIVPSIEDLYGQNSKSNVLGGMKRSGSIKSFKETTILYDSDILRDKINDVSYDFDKLEDDDKIKFINNLAKYFVICNPLDFATHIEFDLYWLRPENFINNLCIFKIDNLKYFVGHSPVVIIDEIFKILHINENTNINKIHNDFLINENNIDNSMDINMISKNKNLKNAMLIAELENQKIDDIIMRLIKQNDYYNIDIFATGGIGGTINTELLINIDRQQLKDNLKDIDKINSVEIGHYMCLFVVIGVDDDVKISKLYMF